MEKDAEMRSRLAKQEDSKHIIPRFIQSESLESSKCEILIFKSPQDHVGDEVRRLIFLSFREIIQVQ